MLTREGRIGTASYKMKGLEMSLVEMHAVEMVAAYA